MNTRKLAATAERDGRWWLVRIPELDTVGQARTVAETQAVAAEIAALYLNVPEESLEVTVAVHVSAEAERAWAEAEEAEAEARRAQERSATLRRAAVRIARGDRYTLDAAAAAFGVSRSRIQQLEEKERPTRISA
ncbi:antitoxin HicB [Microbacteriaceae bacterium VKM Ac-2855]|nr:antitoxin HicB [Microbacteriaceae bacterium VKM Ac-2855]